VRKRRVYRKNYPLWINMKSWNFFTGINYWSHGEVTQLFTKIAENGYKILYLSARSIRSVFLHQLEKCTQTLLSIHRTRYSKAKDIVINQGSMFWSERDREKCKHSWNKYHNFTNQLTITKKEKIWPERKVWFFFLKIFPLVHRLRRWNNSSMASNFYSFYQGSDPGFNNLFFFRTRWGDKIK
jgi:hypothetical protein